MGQKFKQGTVSVSAPWCSGPQLGGMTQMVGVSPGWLNFGSVDLSPYLLPLCGGFRVAGHVTWQVRALK